MVASSACASLRLRPSASRAPVISHCARRLSTRFSLVGRISARRVSGRKNSGAMPAMWLANSGAAIPTMAKALPLIDSVRPTMLRSPPYSRCQAACEITAAGVSPDWVMSSGCSSRPASARTPSALK
jgi:hypothetical protein